MCSPTEDCTNASQMNLAFDLFSNTEDTVFTLSQILSVKSS